MSAMSKKYFKVRVQEVKISRRIVIVMADDRQEAETKALKEANAMRLQFAIAMPEFSILESVSIRKSMVTAPVDQIIK